MRVDAKGGKQTDGQGAWLGASSSDFGARFLHTRGLCGYGSSACVPASECSTLGAQRVKDSTSSFPGTMP